MVQFLKVAQSQNESLNLRGRLISHWEKLQNICNQIERGWSPYFRACHCCSFTYRPSSALLIPVLSATSPLKLSSEVWESVLAKSLQLLGDLNHEALGAAISFIFEAASKFQHLPEAVSMHFYLNYYVGFLCGIIMSVGSLGTWIFFFENSPPTEVSTEFSTVGSSNGARSSNLARTISQCYRHCPRSTRFSHDVAEAVLRDIHSNCELDEVSSPSACGNFSFGETGFNERFNGEEQVFVALRHFSDVYMLIHMLLSPGLAIGASEAFGKAVAQGAILDHKWPC